jgi:hypothetical protein
LLRRTTNCAAFAATWAISHASLHLHDALPLSTIRQTGERVMRNTHRLIALLLAACLANPALAKTSWSESDGERPCPAQAETSGADTADVVTQNASSGKSALLNSQIKPAIRSANPRSARGRWKSLVPGAIK